MVLKRYTLGCQNSNLLVSGSSDLPSCAGKTFPSADFTLEMNRYTLSKILGDGTYGSVIKAVNRQTGEEVAVKKMKKNFTRHENFTQIFIPESHR